MFQFILCIPNQGRVYYIDHLPGMIYITDNPMEATKFAERPCERSMDIKKNCGEMAMPMRLYPDGKITPG